jgi:hypothetical protein
MKVFVVEREEVGGRGYGMGELFTQVILTLYVLASGKAAL